MEAERAIAIVGLGTILPDAPDTDAFWVNLSRGRYSISDVTDRWDPALYYDPDPKAPDKTYSKIGGWVRSFEWDPMAWRMPIPPKVGDMMDLAQKWAVAASRQALLDYGYPGRPLDPERVAVIMGNALGGDFHLMSAARILFPEVGEELRKSPSFRALPSEVRLAVMEELVAGVRSRLPDITEDTMPGELGNIVAGRVAALYDFKGPNYIADAACASAMAAVSAAVEGLVEGDYDAVLTGGIDANMSASTFVKFCKIGALSATGTRPYAEGADGFVMGEGAAVFLLRRLVDAERDGDTVYAVVLGSGGSSDGRGKGITAPNPAGQRFAVERAWKNAGVEPASGDMIEGHGTSTRVGDVVEVETLHAALEGQGLAPGSLSLGSVKSNIGHLKAGAGAAGLMKATLSLHHRALVPSLNFHAPNPSLDFSHSPLRVSTELQPWEKRGSNGGSVRRAGVSAFGFGGTNFHLVLEEYVPGRHRTGGAWARGADLADAPKESAPHPGGSGPESAGGPRPKPPLRGALLVGGASDEEVATRLREVAAAAAEGSAPPPAPPRAAELRAPVRVCIDFGDAGELADLAGRAVVALESGDEGRWRALRNKGVFLGRGAPGKVAFLFTGQGSQYVGMLRTLREAEPVVAATFAEADTVMMPVLRAPLSSKIFVDSDDPAATAAAEEGLKQTAITQPAVLTVDTALARLFGAWGIEPDMVMGHSLGEYGALVAAGGIPFADALTAVAARGDAMTRLSLGDNGLMAAVFGPLEDVSRVVGEVDGYVVVANVNSTKESVIGGASDAVGRAMEALRSAGFRVARLPVSHAFHTEIVAPAADVLRGVLRRLDLRAPRIPVVANVDASFYPTDSDAPAKMVDLLGRQIGSPVQFVKGLEALYDAGCRVFVEMGPKRALTGMAEDVLGGRGDVTVLYTNHPRTDDRIVANRALCGFYALGLGRGVREDLDRAATDGATVLARAVEPVSPPPSRPSTVGRADGDEPEDRLVTLGRMFTEFLEKSFDVYTGGKAPAQGSARVGITGAALGLPGNERVFDDDHVGRILRGDGFIRPVPDRLRSEILDRRITRLVKGSGGEARFETIEDPDEVIKLAGRAGKLDLVDEFGFPEDRLAALDWVTRLAIAAGIDALRDAGIPLVRRYKTTSTGSRLPVGWGLPESMRDDTGIIFGSAFPGYDALVRTVQAYYEDRSRRERLGALEELRQNVSDPTSREELDARMAALEKEVGDQPYRFDRRFLFQVLSMGHSQFAEYIGARGPNTAVNAACATGTQAAALAQDWITAGRCRRVIVVTADDVTTEHMFPWFGSGFLASGAAATDARVEDAALPFDRRRHGLIIGMGGAALVVEDMEAAAERGVVPICELLSTIVANSAFHGSRLDVEHIAGVMERLVGDAERRWSIDRRAMAPEMVFVSHETYTPARGGSAGAEVRALRQVFGAGADDIVVANTKGYTGHPMGVAVEDVLAVKILETGIVPPVANHREVDPELGALNLSRGGSYAVRYALRLAAGFGSQISMSLLRWTSPPDGARRAPGDLGFRHRVADRDRWAAWMRQVTGYPTPELEIVRRTLRVKDRGAMEPVAEEASATPPMEVPVGTPPEPRATVPLERAQPAGVAASAAPAVPAGGTSDAPARAAAVGDPVAAKVLEIVAEQTGYPPDMLELDLDLEADLGIDTVKQAEMFAAIRAAYGIERDENLALRDYPTLSRAIEFVYEKRPDLKAAPASVGAARQASQGGADGVASGTPTALPTLPQGSVDAAQSVPRRVPVARLRPPAERFPVTGVRLEAGARVVVVPDEHGVGRALAERLERLGIEVFIADPSVATETLVEAVEGWRGSGPVRGLYWLPAMDPVPVARLAGPEERREALRKRAKALHALSRALYDELSGPGAFLVSGTRQGGRHGYHAGGASDPPGGAVAGFTKAFGRECPETLVKVVDFEVSRKTAALADLLMLETRRDPGVVEVGYAAGHRWTVGLEERPVEPGDPMDPETVYLVTGAAGSITSAIVADLARQGGRYWLLDLVPEPDASDPDLVRVMTDREGLKRDLFHRMQATGARVTPVLVERELSRLERSASALMAIQAARAAGASVSYRSVDLTDPVAVSAVVSELLGAEGRVDVVLHAAGIEISHALPDKSPEEFALVFDVKVEGWYNLMSALEDTPPGSVMVFSSIAGRFGNAGQTDYAAANDLLCKAVSAMRTTHPETRSIAVDWTAWRDIGMAARGSMPRIMEAAGIDMLAPEAGIAAVGRELSAGTRGEVVIAGALGAMVAEDPDAARLDEEFLVEALRGPMSGRVAGFGLHEGLTVETELDPRAQPFLDDHRIEGTPVLPGVMGLEAMAEAARLPFPDFHVAALEDVTFHAPFKFYRDEPRAVTVRVHYDADGDDVLAYCTLEGTRMLRGRKQPETTLHFAGTVRLSGAPPASAREVALDGPNGKTVGTDAIYGTYFHGPAYRVLGEAWREKDGVVGRFAGDLPDDRSPPGSPAVVSPRLVELAFQTAGLAEIAEVARMGLPEGFRRLELLDSVPAEVESTALARPIPGGRFDVDVADARGRVLLSLSGYRTSMLSGTVDVEPFRDLKA